MGNSAVFSVIGLMVLFGVVTTTFNAIDTRSLQNDISSFKGGSAENIARSGLSIGRLNIDTSQSWPSSFTLTGSLDGGSYVVNSVTTNDTIKMQSIGTFDTSIDTISTKLVRQSTASLFPEIAYTTAFYVCASPLTYNMRYGLLNYTFIDGRDYNINGILTGVVADNVPSVTVLKRTDSSIVRSYTTNLTATLLSTPRIKVDSVAGISNAFVDSMIANSDYLFYTSGVNRTISTSTWGSQAAPVIVTLGGLGSNTLTLGTNSSGCGVLVLKGRVNIRNGFKWTGLVIIYGTSTINFSTSSPTFPYNTVVGGMIAKSTNTTTLRVQYTVQVKHSKAALTMVKNMPKMSSYSGQSILASETH